MYLRCMFVCMYLPERQRKRQKDLETLTSMSSKHSNEGSLSHLGDSNVQKIKSSTFNFLQPAPKNYCGCAQMAILCCQIL